MSEEKKTILSAKTREKIDQWNLRYPPEQKQSGVLEALRMVQDENGGSLTEALMDAVDEWIPTPVRDTDKPFLMAVEDVFSIKGRGTVVTGRIERGKVKVNEEIEIVGIRPTKKSVVTGIEMFHKMLDEGQAGDNAGILLRGVEKDDVERGEERSGREKRRREKIRGDEWKHMRRGVM